MEQKLDELLIENDVFPGLTKKGTVRKRRPKKSLNYFTEDTQNAIIEYLDCTNQRKRNEIYNERINYALYKLAENIIHTFKFYYMDVDDIEDLKHEVMTFILEKLHLYSQSRNVCEKFTRLSRDNGWDYDIESFQKYANYSRKITEQQILDFIDTLDVCDKCKEEFSKVKPPKAYSYFGTVVKRYLINYNEKNYKKLQAHAPVLAADNDDDIINDLTLEFETQDHSVQDFMSMYIDYMDENLFELFPKENDAKIADAVLMLFKHKENLEIFNKKAIFLYIKEMVDVPTRHITKIIIRFKELYEELYYEYETTGYIKM
jgi:hypothetical protein